MLERIARRRISGAPQTETSSNALGRFFKARSGVAAVEFALLAPLLIVMMLGSIEVTHSLWASGKLSHSTDTVNDLISRTPIMDNTEFNNLLLAAPLVLKPYTQGDLRMVVTSIMGCLDDPADTDSDMTYYVLWSRAWQGTSTTSPHAVDAEFGRRPDSLKIADGDTLIVTEGSYTYHPRIARKIGSTIPMDSIAFNQPRDTDRIRYSGLEVSPERSCDDFRAGV